MLLAISWADLHEAVNFEGGRWGIGASIGMGHAFEQSKEARNGAA